MNASLPRAAPLLILLAAVLPSRDAEAAPARRVAVLGLEGLSYGESAAQRLSERLRRIANDHERLGVSDPGSLSVEEARLSFGCIDSTPSCWAQVGQTLSADLVLLGSASRVPTGIAITLEAFDVKLKKRAARLARTLPVKTLNAEFDALARRFLNTLSGTRPARLKLVVAQRGAELRLDGRSIGRSPVPDRRLSPGPHEITVRKAGYRPWSRSLEVQSDEIVELRVSLVKAPASGQKIAPPMGQPTQSTPTTRRVHFGASKTSLGLGSLGAAASLTGVGLVLGAVVQSIEEEYADPNIPQRRAHELKAKGERYALVANVLFGLAAVSTVAGVGLIISEQGAIQLFGHLQPSPNGLHISAGLFY